MRKCLQPLPIEKKELAREGDLLTFKRKRKTIDPSTIVPPNTVDTANEGVSKLVPPTESALAALGAQAESAQADLNAFKSLKAEGVGNSLSLRKLKKHYAYKLEKVLSDGTAAAAKKKGLTTRSFARAYMLYVLGFFLFPMKKSTDVSLWIFAHFPKLAEIPKEMDSDAYEHCTCWKLDVSVTDRYSDDDVGIHQRKEASINEHGDTPVHQFEDVVEQYDTSILECKNLEEKNTSLKAELRQKSSLDDCNQSLSVELNKNCKESESLKAVNTLLMEQIDLHLPPATPLTVLQSHQPVPDTTLAKKYDDLLAAHKDVKKKLIVKEDFHNKLVNSEERKKTLEVDNNEWEVWRQTLKKTLASEGMGDMGDPTFEEFFEQNERFFTIAQQ
ncbi:hypothetical protein GIB67_039734 [Kingdonia uniflora]|uniref:Uncharacterized protein n=1 Tax=Kingdonia uniflora TaxID=39325 RepID=A0A7J7MQ12_9MAGN|nr:hypothetical protein GIB67_039734 [Kingdonia uniflora]